MTIQFYNNTAERNRVNKSSYISAIGQPVTGELRSESDMMNPVLDFAIGTLSFDSINYLYIQELSRYFYIDKVIGLRKNVIRLVCSEDVLMTFKGTKAASGGGIYALGAYITRCEDSQNFALSDTVYPAKVKGTVTSATGTLPAGSEWRSSSDFMSLSSNDIHRYVVMMQGVIQNASHVKQINTYPLATILATDLGFRKFITELCNEQTSISGKPFTDYIYSALCFPFDIDGSNANCKELNMPGIGNVFVLPTADGETSLTYEIPTVSQVLEKTTVKEIEWTVTVLTPSVTRAYKNFRPYTNVILQFQPFGRIELDSSVIFGETNTASVDIKVKVVVDLITGNAQLYYGVGTANILCGSANVAISCPLSASSYNATKIAAGVITTAASIAAVVATDGAAAPAVLGAVSGVASAATAAGTASGGIHGGDMKIIDSAPVIQTICYDTYGEAPELFGHAYCENSFLYNHTGFCQVGRVHVEGFGCYEDERKEIETLLKSGVIL